ncbi:MAG: SDR family oxidoreductase [Candidatus Gottesmanbacteria bacterium]|nr:SDR family oxidoreductase [Candidatus Gottesmanbacteria bacterium]
MNDEKTCLVTGGAGFIGSHLCDKLLGAGYSVICVDNLVTGRKENLSDAFDNSQFIFLDHDVSEPLNRETIKQLNNVSYIFHLASPASVVDYQKYPEETALVNSIGTRNLLEVAQETGAKFLFASTSEVYGDPKEHPQKETYWGNVNPVGIRACYDESKRFGEMMTMVYQRKYKLDARIIRIFNTYGPRMRSDDGRVISNLVNQAIKGEHMTVYGDGTQTRSFCYVSDLVDGIMQAMFGEKTNGEVINLGNPEEYRMVDLALKIKEMIKSASEIIFKELPTDDPHERQPDIAKAKTVLAWEPNVSVTDGLSKTIAYYRSL